jgi:membrane protein
MMRASESGIGSMSCGFAVRGLCGAWTLRCVDLAWNWRAPRPLRWRSPSGCRPKEMKHARHNATRNGGAVNFDSIWPVAKDAGRQWIAHKDARMGAALSYYSVFSIGPLILIAVAIAGLVFGRDAVQGQVADALRGLLGESGAQSINGMLASADRPREGFIATLVGIVTLVAAALGVVLQLKDAFNTVWEVTETPGRGAWAFVRTYVLSLAAALAVGFLLLVSMVMTAGLAAFGKYIGSMLPEAALQIAASGASFAMIALLFALMFKWMPDAQVQWRDVWLGAVATAALFEIGKFLIGFYIGKQGLESTYGAASSLVVVLIWVYYSAQIVLLGAEFTHSQARLAGRVSRG